MVTMAMESSSHMEERLCSRKAYTLHNFTFPTAGWGSGKILRCRKEAKVVGGAESRGSGGSLEEVPSSSKVQRITPDAAENAELPWNLRKGRRESSKEKRKFSVSLSLREIEADFLLINGKKPHKRPKKRPRHVQNQVDDIFPGRYLSNVSPDLYKVE